MYNQINDEMNTLIAFQYNHHIRHWNLPPLVMYLTPLKGLYFSP